MAQLYLELAALATAAVPGLDVVEGTEYSTGSYGDFDAAILKAGDGQLLIARRPRSRAAARQQIADARALAAMSPGVRSRLPFAVPSVVGGLTDGDTNLSVYEFVLGEKADRVPLEPSTMLVAEIGRSIAAIHDLPRVFVEESGLPVLTSDEVRASARSLVARATKTGRLPVAVQRRWEDAVADSTLWQFQPRVIHGSLSLGALLTNGLSIVGVLEWSDLRVGDPARDLHWLQDLDPHVARGILDHYAEAIGGPDRQLRRRAALHAELEIARWLLHGVDANDDAIIADAEATLAALVDRVHHEEAEPLVHETLPILDLAEVQALLRDAGRDDLVTGQSPGASHAGGTDDRDDRRPPAGATARVQTGLVHGETGTSVHPDDNAADDLDHAHDDDLSDDTPPGDFLRDGARSETGEILGLDVRERGAGEG
ncbi:macrolide 2'-phosphotransferase [Pseudoclavibacter endophyticus]|uniref:Macrolide 2'-phosphotransferase n=1 Tax=Pseudoclavibacter endophyticus TaxID=1778590 RepID=A0A6H9WS82_9MICO|nr:macrolide 2'-phosphotransferase [Pseudoclavibacter endophyticus]KAB1649787.1 macrolide 2'-phosphotransferase [Pseudoclavibacter endophyticus]